MVLQLPPVKNFKKDLKKTLGTEIDINMRASAGLYVPDHIHRCPVMPYISRKNLAEIFLGVAEGGTPPKLKYFSRTPPTPPF